jgi:vacuolar-type H+-ATPase subunit E/Vma4
MEVLKTSEIMEKQIIDEARQKASRILQNAEKECHKLEQDLKEQHERDVKRVEEEYNLLFKKMTRELEAALPLDLKRKRLLFIEKAIKENLQEFFKTLKPAELKSLLQLLMTKAKNVFKGKSITLSFNGLSADEAKGLVTSLIPDIRITQTTKDETFTGLLLISADQKIKYRCTLNEIQGILLDDFRDKMQNALLKDQL